MFNRVEVFRGRGGARGNQVCEYRSLRSARYASCINIRSSVYGYVIALSGASGLVSILELVRDVGYGRVQQPTLWLAGTLKCC